MRNYLFFRLIICLRYRKKIVQNITTLIGDESFKLRHRSSKRDFTRERKLTLPQLLLFCLNMVKGSIEDELEQFFETINKAAPGELPVTKSAFTQARKKFSYTAFVELNQRLNTIQADHGRRWRGFRLCAVDGSMINLPERPQLRAHFDPHNKNRPQARASQLYDVLNRVTIDAELAPIAVDERTLAAHHLNKTQEGDLVIYDRGYPAFYLFVMHYLLKRDFCARTPWNLYNETRDFWCSGKQQEIVTLTPSYEAKKTCQEMGLPVDPIRVRLIRVDLDSAEPEILITSVLDDAVIPNEKFMELYHLRWGVEEDYKVMKSRLEVEQFSGLSVLAVQQDFHAKIVSKNLTSVIVNEAQKVVEQKTAHRSHKYKVNFTRALSRMKHNIVSLLNSEDVVSLINRLVQLMATSIEAVRPGRSYERSKSRGPKYSSNYKRAR